MKATTWATSGAIARGCATPRGTTGTGETRRGHMLAVGTVARGAGKRRVAETRARSPAAPLTRDAAPAQPPVAAPAAAAHFAVTAGNSSRVMACIRLALWAGVEVPSG